MNQPANKSARDAALADLKQQRREAVLMIKLVWAAPVAVAAVLGAISAGAAGAAIAAALAGFAMGFPVIAMASLVDGLDRRISEIEREA